MLRTLSAVTRRGQQMRKPLSSFRSAFFVKERSQQQGLEALDVQKFAAELSEKLGGVPLLARVCAHSPVVFRLLEDLATQCVEKSTLNPHVLYPSLLHSGGHVHTQANAVVLGHRAGVDMGAPIEMHRSGTSASKGEALSPAEIAARAATEFDIPLEDASGEAHGGAQEDLECLRFAVRAKSAAMGSTSDLAVRPELRAQVYHVVGYSAFESTLSRVLCVPPSAEVVGKARDILGDPARWAGDLYACPPPPQSHGRSAPRALPVAQRQNNPGLLPLTLKAHYLSRIRERFGFAPAFAQCLVPDPDSLQSFLMLHDAILSPANSLPRTLKVLVMLNCVRTLRNSYLDVLLSKIAVDDCGVAASKLWGAPSSSKAVTAALSLGQMAGKISASFTPSHLSHVREYFSDEQTVELAATIGYVHYLHRLTFAANNVLEPILINFQNTLKWKMGLE